MYFFTCDLEFRRIELIMALLVVCMFEVWALFSHLWYLCLLSLYLFPAYDILSDEQKRKNYDLYGDEKGNPGFGGGSPGDQGGAYFTSGGPGQSGFNFGPDGWQSMGGQGGSKSFSFSFGGPSSQSSYGFGIDDFFSNFFGGGMGGGNQFGFSSSAKSEGRSSSKSIPSVNSQMYRKEVVDKGITWLLLSFTPSLQGTQYFESIIEEVASTLQGALKVSWIIICC